MNNLEFQNQRGGETGEVLIKKLTGGATIPSYGSAGAAGLDLHVDMATEQFDSILLRPGERRLFKTGIAIALPKNTYARIAPRSGLANKYGIDVMAGVVDEDYRGEIGVILVNHSDKDFLVGEHDRIAQLVIEKYLPCNPVVVSDLPDSVRGEGGFGSTGK